MIEKTPSNYAAYVSYLPGRIATGATVAETESLIREAIEFHLEGLKLKGSRQTAFPSLHPVAKSNISTFLPEVS